MLPHHPYSLQQLPNADPEQVNPPVPPQLPSVETFDDEVDKAAGAEEEGVDDETASLVTCPS